MDLNQLGVIAGLITVILTVGFFLFKFSSNQKISLKLINKIIDKQAIIAEKQKLFYQQMDNDIEVFKSRGIEQKGFHDEHDRRISAVIQNQREQEVNQGHIKELFLDMKGLIQDTNKIMMETKIVLVELAVIIKK